ncbi:dienelactone hydrolase family protein [Brevibacillus daliensis]
MHIYDSQHGFSDPYSPKYNEESAQNTWNEALNFLKTK